MLPREQKLKNDIVRYTNVYYDTNFFNNKITKYHLWYN